MYYTVKTNRGCFGSGTTPGILDISAYFSPIIQHHHHHHQNPHSSFFILANGKLGNKQWMCVLVLPFGPRVSVDPCWSIVVHCQVRQPMQSNLLYSVSSTEWLSARLYTWTNFTCWVVTSCQSWEWGWWNFRTNPFYLFQVFSIYVIYNQSGSELEYLGISLDMIIQI